MAAGPAGSSSDNSEEKMIAEGLHFTVGRICEELGAKLEVSFSRSVIATISDITSAQLQSFAADLVAFARHAKRNTITADDVKLLVRRNPTLQEHINAKAEEWEPEALEAKEKKKRGRKKKTESSARADADKDEGSGSDVAAEPQNDQVFTIDD